MIAIDSSVLVRYFVQDDPSQAAAATRLLEEHLSPTTPGLITTVALHETAWVLQRIYKLQPDEVRSIFVHLLDAPNLVVEHFEQVAEALEAPSAFSDALIHFVGQASGCTKTVTFDKRFARLKGVELLV